MQIGLFLRRNKCCRLAILFSNELSLRFDDIPMKTIFDTRQVVLRYLRKVAEEVLGLSILFVITF